MTVTLNQIDHVMEAKTLILEHWGRNREASVTLNQIDKQLGEGRGWRKLTWDPAGLLRRWSMQCWGGRFSRRLLQDRATTMTTSA
jgi:hypothetical protein